MAISTLVSTRLECAVLAAALLSACGWASAGIVIRAGTCSADAFKTGTGVLVGADDDTIQHLSVNCTDDTNDVKKYADYTTGIDQYSSYCAATKAAVEKAGGVLVKDKINGNKYHCLLAGKASKLAKVLTKR
jgi:hypothetical protein